jgi:hypothetical protein
MYVVRPENVYEKKKHCPFWKGKALMSNGKYMIGNFFLCADRIPFIYKISYNNEYGIAVFTELPIIDYEKIRITYMSTREGAYPSTYKNSEIYKLDTARWKSCTKALVGESTDICVTPMFFVFPDLALTQLIKETSDNPNVSKRAVELINWVLGVISHVDENTAVQQVFLVMVAPILIKIFNLDIITILQLQVSSVCELIQSIYKEGLLNLCSKSFIINFPVGFNISHLISDTCGKMTKNENNSLKLFPDVLISKISKLLAQNDINPSLFYQKKSRLSILLNDCDKDEDEDEDEDEDKDKDKDKDKDEDEDEDKDNNKDDNESDAFLLLDFKSNISHNNGKRRCDNKETNARKIIKHSTKETNYEDIKVVFSAVEYIVASYNPASDYLTRCTKLPFISHTKDSGFSMRALLLTNIVQEEYRDRSAHGIEIGYAIKKFNERIMSMKDSTTSALLFEVRTEDDILAICSESAVVKCLKTGFNIRTLVLMFGKVHIWKILREESVIARTVASIVSDKSMISNTGSILRKKCEDILNQDQMKALDLMSGSRFGVVNGLPGTGKSHLMVIFAYFLRSMVSSSEVFVFTSFKNSTVSKMRRMILNPPGKLGLLNWNCVMNESNCKFVTCDSYSLPYNNNNNNNKSNKNKNKNNYNNNNNKNNNNNNNNNKNNNNNNNNKNDPKIPPFAIFVDEAAQVCMTHMYSILTTQGNPTNLYLFGDSRQISSPRPGMPFSDIVACDLPQIQKFVINLKKVERVSTESYKTLSNVMKYIESHSYADLKKLSLPATQTTIFNIDLTLDKFLDSSNFQIRSNPDYILQFCKILYQKYITLNPSLCITRYHNIMCICSVNDMIPAFNLTINIAQFEKREIQRVDLIHTELNAKSRIFYKNMKVVFTETVKFLSEGEIGDFCTSEKGTVVGFLSIDKGYSGILPSYNNFHKSAILNSFDVLQNNKIMYMMIQKDNLEYVIMKTPNPKHLSTKNHVKCGNAITVYESQGDEAHYVIQCLPHTHYLAHNAILLTGTSRSQTSSFIISDSNTLSKTCSTMTKNPISNLKHLLFKTMTETS